MIQGTKIHLRPLERDDLRQLRDWRNHPEIRSRTREYRLLNLENQEDWFASLTHDRSTIMLGIELPLAGTLIGVCGLTYIDWRDQRSEVSLYLAPDQQGKGYGTDALQTLTGYAFTILNLHKLTAEIYSFNEASLNLFQKCGFTEEGRLRRHVYRLGQWCDSVMMARWRDEE